MMLTTRTPSIVTFFHKLDARLGETGIWHMKFAIVPRRIGQTENGQPLWTSWLGFERYMERRYVSDEPRWSDRTEITVERYPLGHPEQTIKIFKYIIHSW